MGAPKGSVGADGVLGPVVELLTRMMRQIEATLKANVEEFREWHDAEIREFREWHGVVHDAHKPMKLLLQNGRSGSSPDRFWLHYPIPRWQAMASPAVNTPLSAGSGRSSAVSPECPRGDGTLFIHDQAKRFRQMDMMAISRRCISSVTDLILKLNRSLTAEKQLSIVFRLPYVL